MTQQREVTSAAVRDDLLRAIQDCARTSTDTARVDVALTAAEAARNLAEAWALLTDQPS